MKIDVILGWLKRLQAQSQPVVVNATANTTITADQAKATVFVTNVGAGAAVTFALPAAKKGMRVFAIVKAAFELRLDPNGTETMALPSSGVQQAAGKYITADAVGESAHYVCTTAGTWDYVGPIDGTWGVES
jgi:hypothetical protein